MVMHLLVAATALAITAAASANIFNEKKIILHIDQFNMVVENNGGLVTFSIILPPGKPVVGFNFEGDWFDDGAGIPTWWASDLTMTITSPTGRKWLVGGWDNVNFRNENWNGWAGSSGGVPPPNQPTGVFPNDGQQFDPLDPLLQIPVFLHSDHFPWKDEPQPKEGKWLITLASDFAAAMPGVRKAYWSNIDIALYNIPAPGALALLGVAGLLTTRRRRR